MSTHFQTIAAWGTVVLTVALFLKSAFKKRKQGCGGGCGCSIKMDKKAIFSKSDP